ncbi:hypothetical protein Q3G72_025886 [Acer saccharum]|nr:hypothetical protein Q3G72_025886 [Acer saccharum]
MQNLIASRAAGAAARLSSRCRSCLVMLGSIGSFFMQLNASSRRPVVSRQTIDGSGAIEASNLAFQKNNSDSSTVALKKTTVKNLPESQQLEELDGSRNIDRICVDGPTSGPLNQDIGVGQTEKDILVVYSGGVLDPGVGGPNLKTHVNQIKEEVSNMSSPIPDRPLIVSSPKKKGSKSWKRAAKEKFKQQIRSLFASPLQRKLAINASVKKSPKRYITSPNHSKSPSKSIREKITPKNRRSSARNTDSEEAQPIGNSPSCKRKVVFELPEDDRSFKKAKLIVSNPDISLSAEPVMQARREP